MRIPDTPLPRAYHRKGNKSIRYITERKHREEAQRTHKIKDMEKYYTKKKADKTIAPVYRNCVAPALVEDVARRMIQLLMVEQKYRDPNYNATSLAKDLDINQRYLSAIISLRFQTNYSQLVGEMRIHEARYMLQSSQFNKMTMMDIAVNCGFGTRQSFYSAFYRHTGITPLDYRRKYNNSHQTLENDEE